MVISFDIWDTILKRRCHPEEIKLHTCKYIVLKYKNILKKNYESIYDILEKRNEIEKQICDDNKNKGYNNECRIIDIFKALQKEIFEKEIEDISEELLKEEIAQEKETIYLNPKILPIFEEYKNLDMYCITDFYMGADNLKELLDYVKVPIKIKKIYSSADYLLNKRMKGDLFKKFEEEIGIEPKDHIHVGDNQYSDIEIANRLGIKTIKIEKEPVEFLPQEGRKFNLNLKSLEKKEDLLFNEGLKLSPILYFFVYSIVEHAITNKIKRVYYFTREGETFIKIHKIIKENNPFGVTIPDCEILEVSRMATFSASLKEFSCDELMRLWSQYKVQSMKTLFKTLAIDINAYKEYFDKYEINIDEDIENIWLNTKFQNLCKNLEFTSKINGNLIEKRKELLRYFKEQKQIENDDEGLFVVDIGWRGTIQDNLAYIFDNKEITGYYLTLFDFHNKQPENTKKYSFISDKSIRDNEVESIITLLEWIYNPGTGSTIGYENGLAIRKAKNEETQIVDKYIKNLQAGMFEGAKFINEYMKYHPYLAYETKEYVYELIRKLKKKPSKTLLEAYFNMVFNDTFGTAKYVEKTNKLTFVQKLNIKKCRDLFREEQWKEAFVIYNNVRIFKCFGKNEIISKKNNRKEIIICKNIYYYMVTRKTKIIYALKICFPMLYK